LEKIKIQQSHKGTTITQAKELSDHSSGDNGITEFGEKVGDRTTTDEGG